MRNAIKQSIVRILDAELGEMDAEFLGSGFVLGPQLIVTCAHVLQGRDQFRIECTGQSLEARCVACFTPFDVALLRVAEPLQGPALSFVAPLDTDALSQLSGQLEVHGFVERGYTQATQRKLKNVWRSESGHHGQIEGGLPEGMSGSPLLVISQGQPRVLGMIYSGGADAGQTAFYGADELSALLAERGVELSVQRLLPARSWLKQASVAGGLLACTLAAWLGPGLLPGAPIPAGAAPVAAPTAADSCTQPAPPKPAGHTRIAIAHFRQVSSKANELGAAVAEQVKITLDRMREEQVFEELGPDIASQIEIVVVPCTVERHEEAEKVASQWQADLVLWGHAYNALGADQFSITPRATLLRPEASLHNSSDTPLAFKGMQAMDWQQLGSSSPLQLVPLALGLHFLDQRNAWIAARFFVMFEQGHHDALDKRQGTPLKALLGEALLESPGRAAQAIELSRAALATDPVASVAGRLLINIGVGYNEEAKYAEAIAAFEQALQSFERQADTVSSARALNNIGSSWSHQDKHEQALVFYERAERLLEHTSSDELASVLSNIGSAWDALGDHTKAIDFYTRTIALLDARDVKHPGLAGVLNNLGLAQVANADFAHAEQSYQRALALDRERLQDKHPAVARDWANLGDLYEARGDRAQAYRCYEAAHDVVRRLNPQQPLAAADDLVSLRAKLKDRLGPRRCTETIHNAATQ